MQIKSCRHVALILATPRFIFKPIALFALIWILAITLTNCAGVPVQVDTPQVPTLGDVLVVADEWEGPIDPHQFKDWEILGGKPCPAGAPDYHVLLRNPRGNPDVVEIVIIPHQNGEQIILMGYGYKKDDVFYVFGIQPNNKQKYAQIQPEKA